MLLVFFSWRTFSGASVLSCPMLHNIMGEVYQEHLDHQIMQTVQENSDLINKLPQLLIIHPPQVFLEHENEFCNKFKVLKAYESPLPTNIFLKTHAQSVKAMLSSSKVPVKADLLQHLPSLELVVSVATGVNQIDLLECSRRGIAVANTADVFSEDTADAAVGLLIDVLRNISAGDRFIRRGLWTMVNGDFHLSSKLGGRRVGIIGLGNIGSKVAKRLEVFGCSIAYNSRTKKPSIPYQFFSSVQQLASHCNVLIVCCSLTNETRHMINKVVLTALGKHGIIINVGRGAIVDEEELVKCLVRGDIGGAGLDVFENEPNVPEELLALDNVVITPHRSGFTAEAIFISFQIIMGNLEGYFFSNKTLLSPITAE